MVTSTKGQLQTPPIGDSLSLAAEDDPGVTVALDAAVAVVGRLGAARVVRVEEVLVVVLVHTDTDTHNNQQGGPRNQRQVYT